MSNRLQLRFVRLDSRAILPTKGSKDAIGYDLTAISVHSKPTNRTTLFDTGLSVAVPDGFYTEIVPRSSIVKTGYVLANSIGVIDPDYRGRLLIALMKLDDSCPDLVPPFRLCQLVIRPHLTNFVSTEVSSLDATERGEGGFGSTNRN
jgi:dUTP pyrophosphatase